MIIQEGCNTVEHIRTRLSRGILKCPQSHAVLLAEIDRLNSKIDTAKKIAHEEEAWDTDVLAVLLEMREALE